MTLIWADGDDIIFFSHRERVKIRNLRRAPRVVLSFEDPGAGPRNLKQYLVIYGRAEVCPDEDITDLRDRLAQRYMGLDHFPYAEPEQIMVRVKVDRVAGNGPWKN